MDFKIVLKNLLTAFNERKIRYALIGGLALGLWGVPKGTVDIDFLVHREDITKVHGIMLALGYELKYNSENVSQYLSPLKIFGEVDYIHAFRTPSLGMLERAEDCLIFNGAFSIKVLKVEDLIGLKLQAIKNNESRRALDISDIEMLMSFRVSEIDWELLKEYFLLFGFDALYDELKRKYA